MLKEFQLMPMEPLRIMLHRQYEHLDHTLSFYVGLESVLDEISKMLPIKVIWIVDQGGEKTNKFDEHINVYNVYSFNDFTEIIDELKPGLIITIAGDNEYLERSMLKAASHMGIPTVDIMTSVIEDSYFKKRLSIKLIRGRIFVLIDHGLDLLKRYNFLMKTLSSAKFGIKYRIKTLLKDIYLPLTSFNPRYNFGSADLNIVSSPKWAEYIEKKGINRQSIRIVGDISMDSLYYKLQNLRAINNSGSGRQSFLLISSPMVEHGYWMPWMRKKVVSEIVTHIKDNFRDAEFQIKIHPIREDIQDYKKIVDELDPSIKILQGVDLTELIQQSDIIIGFGITSAYFEALFLKKPVLLMNLFAEDVSQNIYIRENLITECKTAGELVDHIHKSTYTLPSVSKLNQIIEILFYKFDGKCSTRAANHIISYLNKSN